MTNMKAQVGDLIRITKILSGCSNFVKVGEIYEVSALEKYGVRVKFNGKQQGNYVADIEYVIHRKAGEEDSPLKAEIDVQIGGTWNGFYEEKLAQMRELVTEDALARAEQVAQDAVNSPNHYTQGKFETIEIIEEITKGYSDGYVAYCVGNALKYLARAPFKHGEPSEDLSKAAKYLAFASEYLDAK